MLDIFSIAGALIGGLGLFILAIDMMTDGLRLATGSSLRRLLSDWTNTPIKGILSGFMMTAVVQSSSAVTVASIGFVNAGLLTMRHALGVVYGSNIGTTMTGWLIAFTGFKFDIHSYALPLIGVGMLIKLIKKQGRAASFGLALVGFGLFFIGIDVLRNAFENLVLVFDLSKVSVEGVSGIAVFTLIGIAMTILTQSSSASIALTITAASTGVIDIMAAAAMVIGANIGTTSTALIAAIGATSNAKRVALAQMIFNAATAMVAFLMLPILFYIIEFIRSFFALEASSAISLAMFHSAFNILGVLIIFPLNNRLVAFLEKRFVSWEETQRHSQYLDKTIAATPDLAVNALALELKAIAQRLAELSNQTLYADAKIAKKFKEQSAVIKYLLENVSEFIVTIEREELSEKTTKDLATIMRIQQYFLTCNIACEHIFQTFFIKENMMHSDFQATHNEFIVDVIRFINIESIDEADFALFMTDELVQLQQAHDQYKAGLLLAGTKGQISVNLMSEIIDGLAEVLKLVQQWGKAMKSFSVLHSSLNVVNKIEESEDSKQQVNDSN